MSKLRLLVFDLGNRMLIESRTSRFGALSAPILFVVGFWGCISDVRMVFILTSHVITNRQTAIWLTMYNTAMQTITEPQSSTRIHTTPTDDESLTVAIIRAVTQKNGMEPAVPLYEAIDTDALECLAWDTTVEISFEYIGYRITIQGDDIITVSDL